MDPVVQVALVSVFATIVTTLGVVATAFINKRSKVDRPDPDLELDAGELFERILSMAAENQRKEASIQKLRSQIQEYRARTSYLEDLLKTKKEGLTHERHDGLPGDAEQEPDLE